MNLSRSTRHFALALVSLIALVVLQVLGKPSPDLTAMLGAVLGASAYGGALTRQPPEQKP